MVIFNRYTWWVGAMAGFAVFLTLMGQAGVLGPVQGAYLTATEPFEDALSDTFRPMTGFLANAGDLDAIRDENRELRVENETLRNQVIELELLKARIAELEAAANISQSRPDETRLVAGVVNRIVTPFTEEISIDKGSSDGIKTGMVVLSAQGTLIGSITEVTGDRAFVRTVNDSRSRVLAEVLETHVEGTVRGTANRKMEFDYAAGAVNVGENVVTSALSGKYPPGIPVAKVAEVSGGPQDLFPTVRLESLVRISAATTVLVITSFVPEEAPAAAAP